MSGHTKVRKTIASRTAPEAVIHYRRAGGGLRYKLLVSGSSLHSGAMQFVHHVDLGGAPDGDSRRDHGYGDYGHGRGCERRKVVRDAEHQILEPTRDGPAG